MENAGYLLAAFTIIWAIIFAYILFLFSKQAKLKKEIDLLKQSQKVKTA